jgi:tRNA 2-thiouridine synthesizing protein E
MNTNRTRDLGQLFGANGFLVDPDRWDPDLAQRIAEEVGIEELGDAHRKVIDYLREHYLEFGSLPWEAHVCKSLDLHPDCIHALFGGPVEAWKVAGLPDPGEEARTYMLNQEE